MLCREIIEKMEETYPKDYAMEWDNVGLLAGRKEKEVAKILVALDLTDEVVEEALACETDMIVTHHPLIFSPLRSVTDQNFISKRVIRLIQNDISYYAMHTNYDILRMGELAADILGMKHTEPLESMSIQGKEEGIGKLGVFSGNMKLKDCCFLVKEKFGLEAVRVFGDLEKEIVRVAVCPGSGKSVINTALQKGADVLITGDIDHHEGIDAVAGNLAIIDAGHYGLEHIYMKDMEEFLKRSFSGIEVRMSKQKAPFRFV